ncbi:MAG: exodeoxyribonuclease VII large subunit [Acetobacter sp.]|nr:exodeoxyribonuclease VII large subunit [Bacteroides sp.]MCM1340590.1 exodeoxyribonuclease VII large subunit [Acetobacter sp.]MCM1433330.1 exodeoxyribonuclease VII large subunit [Clostridiales bacterium]
MNVVTVTQVNTFIKFLIDGERRLNSIYVVGEISNFTKHYRSGHLYLTLKDEKSQLKGVMFAGSASKLKFDLSNGMRVICRGRITSYERDGVYQLVIDDMQPDGIGALSVAYEQLKAKLADEGLFDTQHKKPIPKFPKKIGVVTSTTGAAIEDIKNITARRYPLAELIIVPTTVQGETAPSDIIKSIKLLDSIDDIDVIIVGRGGGSAEDLWAFNDENVARTIYSCNRPIISAVGHETDYTICDFVSDMRASTPSAAAELATPDINEMKDSLKIFKGSLIKSLNMRLEFEFQRFDNVLNSILFEPKEYIENQVIRFKEFTDDLNSAYRSNVERHANNLSILAGKLDSLSPLAVLGRGYCSAEKNGKLIKSAKELSIGETFSLKLSDGIAECTVNEVNYE